MAVNFIIAFFLRQKFSKYGNVYCSQRLSTCTRSPCTSMQGPHVPPAWDKETVFSKQELSSRQWGNGASSKRLILGKGLPLGTTLHYNLRAIFLPQGGGGCDAMFALSCSVVLFLCLCLTILGLFPSYAPQRKGPGVLLFFPVGHTVLIPLHLLTELFPLMASGPGSGLHTFHPCTS